MIKYIRPTEWMKYDPVKVATALATARASLLTLTTIPLQRNWADEMQEVQLKREVAGTSRIEGADFTESELDEAIRDESPEQLRTRSQRQAAAAVRTYRWIGSLPEDVLVDKNLILEVHRLIVTGADDDHCPPGAIRKKDQNVTFGEPRHRGCEGGTECDTQFESLCQAVTKEFRSHNILVQALALHYHLAAMHPFLDGNGRTARALEALFLRKAGLKDILFISMSNYYYEEKPTYLGTLAKTRASGHDLTEFLLFGLAGIELQCSRLFDEIRKHISKALYRNMMYDLFTRLRSARKRVIMDRQIEILKVLLNEYRMEIGPLLERVNTFYDGLKAPWHAIERDLNGLISLGAIGFEKHDDAGYIFWVNLDWPTTITETEFFRTIEEMPKAKTYKFL